jgi:ABC-type amino acid transport substrate-binding protein
MFLSRLSFLALIVVTSLASMPSFSAKDVFIGVGNFKPYFIIEGRTGIFPDIITSVFRHIPNYQPVYFYDLPNNGLLTNYNSRRIDAVANLFDGTEFSGCRSNPVFRFRDVAISQASSELTIDDLSDLENKKIVSFQGAKDFLGKEYADYVSKGVYSEVDKPELQARMLLSKRHEVSVGDMYIFFYALRGLKSQAEISDNLKVHDIFPQLHSRIGFRDEKLCGLFNQGLKKIKASGEYERIYESYLEKLKP